MDRLCIIKSYYDNLDQRLSQISYSMIETGIGHYVPSNINHIANIGHMIASNSREPIRYLDAGGGDGRTAAVMQGVWGIRSAVVEYSRGLCEETEAHYAALLEKGGITEDIPILNGDFKDESTYQSAGIEFSTFTHIFNFLNNARDAAGMIKAFSPPGTTFLYLNAGTGYPIFSGLTHQSMHILEDPSTLVTRIKPKDQSGSTSLEAHTSFLHVYIKEECRNTGCIPYSSELPQRL